MTALPELLAIPTDRADTLRRIAARLLAARHVVLTTHVNADGDGVGSQVAVAAWLAQRGVASTIVNPTPFPPGYRFLLPSQEWVADLGTPAGERALAAADLVLVLDTSEAKRVPGIAERLRPDHTLVIDHHPAGPDVVGSLALQDARAAATGELVYDLITLHGDEWPAAAPEGVYVAILTDTGSFRHANTTPRVHAIGAVLLHMGVRPEPIWRRVYGQLPLRRLELLREALGTLRLEPDAPVAWMLVENRVVERLGATSEDLDGLIEHARAVDGTEVALLFRELPDGETKVSFRSNGGADVNRVARRFGGGGHVRASGATAAGPPALVVPQVLAAVKEELAG